MVRSETRLVSKIPEIIAGAEANAAIAVRKTCDRIETRAKARSRVDTGAMRDGWQSQMIASMEGIVYNLIEYTVYNEFGTIFMSAQPMLQPAIEESKDEFVDDLAAGYDGRLLV